MASGSHWLGVLHSSNSDAPPIHDKRRYMSRQSQLQGNFCTSFQRIDLRVALVQTCLRYLCVVWSYRVRRGPGRWAVP
jgi:hypothetical protein